jgi:hypothetical protein
LDTRVEAPDEHHQRQLAADQLLRHTQIQVAELIHILHHVTGTVLTASLEGRHCLFFNEQLAEAVRENSDELLECAGQCVGLMPAPEQRGGWAIEPCEAEGHDLLLGEAGVHRQRAQLEGEILQSLELALELVRRHQLARHVVALVATLEVGTCLSTFSQRRCQRTTT